MSNTVSELKDLVNTIKNGKQSQGPSIISHILSSDKVCIHYTGFSVSVCKAIFTYLDPGEMEKTWFCTIIKMPKKKTHS